MIDTVLAQPLNGGSVRVTVYRQPVDLIAQGRADHDERLARRAYEAIDAIREDVPRAVRAALAPARAGFVVPARPVVPFRRDCGQDGCACSAVVRLGQDEVVRSLPSQP